MTAAGLVPVYSPGFADGTCIVANSRYVQVWEQDKGALTLANPSSMSIDVAYRGYLGLRVRSEGLCSVE
jgi:hypothetical protein